VSGIRQAAAFLLFQAGRTADRAARLSHYLAIGTCRLADLRAGIRDSWEDFYATDDASRGFLLLAWEEALAERFFPAGSHLLVIGCGAGRDLIALAERGCQVTGIEPSASALRQARRALADRKIPAALMEGFFEDEPIQDSFDTVIFSYYSYASIPVSRRRIEALRKAAGLLEPGGHVVVSYASRLAPPRRYLIRLGRTLARLCRSDWRLEEGDVVWENRRARPSYSYTHAFAPGELEREASDAGLTPVLRELTSDGSVVIVLEGP
jgi:SAM-dependent methyltransferase